MKFMEKVVVLFIGSIVKEKVVFGFVVSIKRRLEIFLLDVSKISQKSIKYFRPRVNYSFSVIK